MKIESLYRISSHQQTIEVDDVSMSLNKVSNQVLVMQQPIPDVEIQKTMIEQRLIGAIVLVDKIDFSPIQPFDSISGEEIDLKVIESFETNGIKALTCLPENFSSFALEKVLHHHPKVFKVHVVTLSDRAHRGVYKDESGPTAVEILKEYFHQIQYKVTVHKGIIPDKKEELEDIIADLAESKTDILITTGGTGIGPRDITIETIRPFMTKDIPGIMDAIRIKYGATNPAALTTRAIAGTIGQCLVFTLPGSPKAVKEYLTEICPALKHLLAMLHGMSH